MRNRAGQKLNRCRRGSVMLLVLLATATALTLSIVIIVKQSTMTSISQNVSPQPQARAIAESGLDLAISEVRKDPSWRTTFSHGVWITDEPLYEGSFSVMGEDGVDTDGNETVDGDGDLADDDRDLLTLSSTGTYQGAQHTARAVLEPSFNKHVLLIVPNPNSLTAEDVARTELLKSWGWRVSHADEDIDKDDLTAAASQVNVVYVGANVTYQGDLKDPLRKTERGVVLEQYKLIKEIRLAGDESNDYDDTQIEILELTELIENDLGVEVPEVYTHYITRPFAVGPINVSLVAEDLLRHRGTMYDDVAILADRTLNTDPVLLAVDNGGELKGKPVLGRRVAMPWGDDDWSVNFLTSDGKVLLRRALDWAGQTWKGPLPSIAVFDKIEVKGTGSIDSFNSLQGAYGGANVGSNATIATNNFKDKKIHIKDNGVAGATAYIQQGADPTKVVKVDGSASLSGLTLTLNVGVPIPLEEAPVIDNNMGNVTLTNGTTLIDSSRTYGNLRIQGSAVVEVSGNVQVYITGDLDMQNNAEIRLLPGATLDLYTRKDAKITGSALINANTGDASALNWHILDKKIVLEDSAQLYAVVTGRKGTLEVKDTSQFFGMFRGKKCKVENGSFHADLAVSGSPTTIGGGFVPLPDYAIRWK